MRLAISLAAWLAATVAWAAPPLCIYIGTYAKAKGQGIHRLELDPDTGKLTSRGVVAEVTNPSFLAMSPDRRFLYSVSEVSGSPGVVGFSIGADGGLTPLNGQASGGGGPCHIDINPAGTLIAVANYGGGSVRLIPIEADGKLGRPGPVVQHVGGSGVVADRQRGPHAHCVRFDGAGRFVVVSDLGLDQLKVYRVEGNTLVPHAEVPVGPGTGPRHFAFHPLLTMGFSINELSSTLTSFRYDAATGSLRSTGSVPTLPADFKGLNTTAEVRVHPNGRWIYASNRGHDSIAMFSIESDGGLAKPMGHVSTEGKTPRNFALDDHGRFLVAANQNSGTVVSFRIDPATGRCTPVGSSVAVPSPVCVLFRNPGASP